MASDFVDRTLGLWSSHPANLRKQKKWLLILGFLPILAVAVICVLVYNKQFSWSAVTEQIGVLTYSVFFVLGFLLTLCVLYLACFTFGSKAKITNKDELFFPSWLLFIFCFFWLLPYCLSILPKIPLLKQFDLALEHKVILNMLAVAPFLCVLTWILCAKEEELKPNEKLVRRPWVLSIALICAGSLAAAFFLPAYQLRLCIWIVLLPLSIIFFSLWWLWRKKITLDDEAKTAQKKAEAEDTEADLPEQAAYIISNLPEGISYGGDGGFRYEDGGEKQDKADKRKLQPGRFSKLIQLDDETTSLPLIVQLNGLVPTEDQKAFLLRFKSLYENSLDTFFEERKADSEQSLPDIILQGPDGSGRTEALCGAALYAAVVRGQNVLYIVQDSSYAKSLAAKMQSRFHNLMMDSYYTADYLQSSFVDAWIGGVKIEDKAIPKLPPNILFATPERVESFFFNYGNQSTAKKQEKLRNILLSYSVILVDDFLEMPIPLQAHLAFILDKCRLLQASEYVMGQFVIATVPLQDPYGIDTLAQRLFDMSRFDRQKNTILLHPRPYEPFWCGTLRIDPAVYHGELALENAARSLLDICTATDYNTLFYSKGISRKEAESLEGAYKEKGGRVSVSSCLYQLNVEAMPFDTILYLSLTSGNAAAALRLSLPDDKAGTPVFFRIALENEAEKTVMDQFALLPNETAFSLCAWHLRSILPFIPRLTPISAGVWNYFGISLDSPPIESKNIEQKPDGVAVKWYYDYYVSERYRNEIWPYLVLDAETQTSNQGQDIDFSLLPVNKDYIGRDSQTDNEKGETFHFVSAGSVETGSKTLPQFAVWRSPGKSNLGTTDLAHSDLLTLITNVNHYSVQDIEAANPGSGYAMVIRADFRHGLSYDIPVRHFSWDLVPSGFKPEKIKWTEKDSQKDFAAFTLRFGEFSFTNPAAAHTNPVTAQITGLVNPVGVYTSTDTSQGKYGYDAFMSCLVFLPEGDQGADPAVGITQSLSGQWSTASTRFSSSLTHAFSIALRNRMAGLSFFAITPVFLPEERDSGWLGRLLLWLIEPSNSGRTVYPLLMKLFRESDCDFETDLLKDVRHILQPNDKNVTLKDLRIRSQLAFSGEDKLSPKQWEIEVKRGLHVIDLLLDAKTWEDDREQKEKRRREFIDPTCRSEEDRKQYEEFASVVKPALMDFKDVIDVSHFCADYGWTQEKVDEVFEDFLWNSPDIFFVAKSYRSKYIEEGDKITSFQITNLRYGIQKEEYQEAKSRLDAETAKAMKLIKGVSDPVKKALILHDHIVRICEYDEKARDDKDPSPLARTAYSVLVRGLAVCEGYVMGYRYLLNLAGIRSEEVLSDNMNHCWNYLYLNGNWYHVDVTFDDPVYRGGKPDNDKVSHEYFLLSDEKLLSKEHYAWSVRGLPAASDTQFDNQNWDSY